MVLYTIPFLTMFLPVVPVGILSVTIVLRCNVSLLQSFLCLLCFAFCSLLQSRRRGVRAPCHSETPHIGERGSHEAEGTIELKGKRATVRKFFSYSRMAVDIIKIICLSLLLILREKVKVSLVLHSLDFHRRTT